MSAFERIFYYLSRHLKCDRTMRLKFKEACVWDVFSGLVVLCGHPSISWHSEVFTFSVIG